MPGVDGAVKVAVKATACPGSTGSTGNATRPKPQLELSLGFSEPKLYMLAVVQEVSPVFVMVIVAVKVAPGATEAGALIRSEEHTSELQSQFHLVCRLLLEKKNI